jgi:hypothetical protein
MLSKSCLLMKKRKKKESNQYAFSISKKKELKLKVPRQLFCLCKYFNYRATEEKTNNNIIMHDYWYMNIYKRTTSNSKFRGERRDDCLIFRKMFSIVCTETQRELASFYLEIRSGNHLLYTITASSPNVFPRKIVYIRPWK